MTNDNKTTVQIWFLADLHFQRTLRFWSLFDQHAMITHGISKTGRQYFHLACTVHKCGTQVTWRDFQDSDLKSGSDRYEHSRYRLAGLRDINSWWRFYAELARWVLELLGGIFLENLSKTLFQDLLPFLQGTWRGSVRTGVTEQLLLLEYCFGLWWMDHQITSEHLPVRRSRKTVWKALDTL